MIEWWYLSFANEKGFQGACIVPGENFLQARLLASRFKAVPTAEGCEVVGVKMDPTTLTVDLTCHLLNENEVRLKLDAKRLNET